MLFPAKNTWTPAFTSCNVQNFFHASGSLPLKSVRVLFRALSRFDSCSFQSCVWGGMLGDGLTSCIPAPDIVLGRPSWGADKAFISLTPVICRCFLKFTPSLVGVGGGGGGVGGRGQKSAGLREEMDQAIKNKADSDLPPPGRPADSGAEFRRPPAPKEQKVPLSGREGNPPFA